jgi:hypothetical protein
MRGSDLSQVGGEIAPVVTSAVWPARAGALNNSLAAPANKNNKIRVVSFVRIVVLLLFVSLRASASGSTLHPGRHCEQDANLRLFADELYQVSFGFTTNLTTAPS